MTGVRIAVALVMGVMLMGCGEPGLKVGEMLETSETLRIRAESTWEDGTTEAFTADVPAGTQFRVLSAQRANIDAIECVVTKLSGNEDVSFISEQMLPVHLKGRFGFKGFTVTLPLAEMGTKIKKLAAQ